MTAVGLQQQQHGVHQHNPRQSPHSSNMSSRPQSYQSASQAQILRQEPPVQNGNSPLMGHRPAVSNEPVNGNGHPHTEDDRIQSTTNGGTTNTSDLPYRRRASFQGRPTSAPNGAAESSQDDSETDIVRRRPKPLLHRAKSDFGPRGEERYSADEEIHDWGARHGFEDHYASEEYVSQLANVGSSFPLCLNSIYHHTITSLIAIFALLLFPPPPPPGDTPPTLISPTTL